MRGGLWKDLNSHVQLNIPLNFRIWAVKKTLLEFDSTLNFWDTMDITAARGSPLKAAPTSVSDIDVKSQGLDWRQLEEDIDWDLRTAIDEQLYYMHKYGKCSAHCEILGSYQQQHHQHHIFRAHF